MLHTAAPNGSVLLNSFRWDAFNTNQHYSVKRARKHTHTQHTPTCPFLTVMSMQNLFKVRLSLRATQTQTYKICLLDILYTLISNTLPETFAQPFSGLYFLRSSDSTRYVDRSHRKGILAYTP